MRLHDVANRFNRLVCLDGYTGVDLFRAQLALYDDNKRDSETAERRVLSVSPTVVIPARRVIQAAGTRYIVGHGNPDDYNGTTIRVGHTVHEATHLAYYRTLGQACRGIAPVAAYAGRAWVKNITHTDELSKLTPLHHIHFALNEQVEPNSLVDFGGRQHLVRAVVHGPAGTLVAACEEMSEPSVETASLVSGVYDPVTETSTGAPISVIVVRVRWQSLFAYLNSAAPKFEPGDIQVVISTSIGAIANGARLTLSDGTWLIRSVVAEGDVYLCRATRHG